MEKKMRNVFVVLIVTLAASVALADGATVAYKYVDASGVISFTDDEKRVPAKYKDVAEKVTLGELGDYERFTALSTVGVTVESPRLTALRAANAAPVATTKPDCGAVTVRSERRDVEGGAGGDGSFNTRFFIAEDDCGILFDAPYYPELNALRR
jgi:hypothetical protein